MTTATTCDPFICPDCLAELVTESGTHAHCDVCKQWITRRGTPRPAPGRSDPAPGFTVWRAGTGVVSSWHYGTETPYQLMCVTPEESRASAVLATWAIYDQLRRAT